MRRVFVWGMIGFLGAVVGFTPLAAWAGWGEQSAPWMVAQRQRGERLRERIQQGGGEHGRLQGAVRQDATEWQQAWQGLTPDQRTTLTQAWQDTAEKIKGLTPEQKQQLKQATAQTIAQLKDLSPEQKAQLEQQLKKSAQAYASLTAQQKQEMLTQLADSINQTGSLSPEQKAMLKANYQKLLGV